MKPIWITDEVMQINLDDESVAVTNAKDGRVEKVSVTPMEDEIDAAVKTALAVSHLSNLTATDALIAVCKANEIDEEEALMQLWKSDNSEPISSYPFKISGIEISLRDSYRAKGFYYECHDGWETELTEDVMEAKEVEVLGAIECEDGTFIYKLSPVPTACASFDTEEEAVEYLKSRWL